LRPSNVSFTIETGIRFQPVGQELVELVREVGAVLDWAMARSRSF